MKNRNFHHNILLAILSLSCLISSCSKEDRLMRKQAGVWEITKWQCTTYANGVIATDTSIVDLGYLSLYDSGLNGFNQAHYALSYSPPSWNNIANNNTGLDPKDDYCFWQSDHNTPNRFALEYKGQLGEVVQMMFSVNKISRNKQEWIYIGTGNDPNSSMASKEIFTMERVH